MATTPFSEKLELGKSLAKLLIERLHAGEWLNEFLDVRTRIKQNRLNNFIESLQVYFDQSAGNSRFHFDLLSDEEITDIFEGVLRRVAQTKSITKIERFRNILLNHLNAKSSIDMVETFLDLTLSLHDKQIEILLQHDLLVEKLGTDNILEMNNLIKIQLEKEKELRINGKPNNFSAIKEKLDQFLEKRNGRYYGIKEQDYMFFIQDLVGKIGDTDPLNSFEVDPLFSEQTDPPFSL